MHTTSADTVAAVTAAFTLYWHDCWCPDFFLDAAFHVDYCPTHGYPWRAQIELAAPLTSCGCDKCQESLASFEAEFADGTLRNRASGFVGEFGRIPVLAVRTSLAATAAR